MVIQSKGLVDAIQAIVFKFGKDVLTEERFVNILADVNPDKNNSAIYGIIRTLIKDGLCADLLVCSEDGIQMFISKTTLALNQKYGYDKKLVEDILKSLAIGSGVVRQKHIETPAPAAPVLPTNQTVQKPARPIPPRPSKPATQHKPVQQPKPIQPAPKSNSKRKIRIDWQLIKLSIVLFWGIAGLFFSPIVYSNLICVAGWWPLPASIIVAIIQLFTIVPAIATFESAYSKKNFVQHSILEGGLCALLLLAMVYWLIYPLVFSIYCIQSFLAFNINKEAFPLVSIILNIFCAIIIGVSLKQNVASFSGSWISFWGSLKQLLSIRKFRKGFLYVVVFFILSGIVVTTIQLAKIINYRNDIKEFNQKVEIINQHKDSIRNERCKIERNLSFAQFGLGDNLSTCLSIIDKSAEYSIADISFNYSDLCVNEEDYQSIADTIVNVNSIWNNEEISIRLFFNDNKLFAIKYRTELTSVDSILSIYTKKYGEPEYTLKEYSEPTYDEEMYIVNNIYYEEDGHKWIMEELLTPHKYYWTYKKSLLIISASYGSCSILYFDRNAENKLKKKKEEESAREKELEKRRNDSIRRVEEHEQRLREEQKRREEINHQKSIEQI